MSESAIISCPACGALNRAPRDKLARGEAPTCGQCHAPLFDGVVALADAAAFDRMIGKTELPVLVDFWAAWCGPCRMIAPHIESLADEYAGKVVVGKVNVDDNQDLAAQFRINTIPQVYIFKNGEVVERLSGAQPKTAYAAAVEKVLKS